MWLCSISTYFFVEEIQCQLQPDCFHVSLLQCRGDVHVHVEKMPHDSVLFRLLDFQLREQFDEPFERLLVTIYPEEVHLCSRQRKSNIMFTNCCSSWKNVGGTRRVAEWLHVQKKKKIEIFNFAAAAALLEYLWNRMFTLHFLHHLIILAKH